MPQRGIIGVRCTAAVEPYLRVGKNRVQGGEDGDICQRQDVPQEHVAALHRRLQLSQGCLQVHSPFKILFVRLQAPI